MTAYSHRKMSCTMGLFVVLLNKAQMPAAARWEGVVSLGYVVDLRAFGYMLKLLLFPQTSTNLSYRERSFIRCFWMRHPKVTALSIYHLPFSTVLQVGIHFVSFHLLMIFYVFTACIYLLILGSVFPRRVFPLFVWCWVYEILISFTATLYSGF
jgi:hypothetical protein